MRSTILSLIAVVVAAVVAAPGLIQAQQPIRIGASIAITGRDAVQGGYDAHDVTLWSGPQVATGARELQQSASMIARIFGAELEAMNKHIELADAGYTFVVAYCPSDLDTKRLMNVAHRFRYGLAQKYDRFSITDL
jgi:hypothetical protein